MNGHPHTHKIVVKREFSDGTGGWVVIYGDTKVHVTALGRLWIDHVERRPSDRRIRRAINRAIRAHDRGSIRALEALENAREPAFVAEMNAKLKDDAWASESLR